jgi:hypothetical protein
LLGDRTLTLVGSGLCHRIRGTGTNHSGGIRFHQKDLGPDGRDVRVWTITHPSDDVLLAQHCPAFEPPTARRDPRSVRAPADLPRAVTLPLTVGPAGERCMAPRTPAGHHHNRVNDTADQNRPPYYAAASRVPPTASIKASCTSGREDNP